MRLPPGEVHVWRARLDPPAHTVARLRAPLSDDERARVGRVRVPAVARRLAVARGTLRWLLADYLSTAPAGITIAIAPGGKPRLPGDPLHFSVSHSGEVAVFAIGRTPVGIDVEDPDPGRAVMPIARRFFAPEEIDALDRAADNDRERAFYRCWTRKEAYLKARGVGLVEPLRGFAVSVEPGPSRVGVWRLLDLDLGPRVVGAVATIETGAVVVERDVLSQ